MQGHGYGQRFQMKRIYVHFRRTGDNAHGNTVGFHGSLNPNSLYSVLRSLNVDGGDFVDFVSVPGMVNLWLLLYTSVQAVSTGSNFHKTVQTN